MKKDNILFLVNGLSPYRLDFFHELGNKCNLTVLCEQKRAKNRKWQIDESKCDNFKLKVLQGKTYSPDTAFCPSVVQYLSRRKYDVIIIANYNTLTGMLAIVYLKSKGIKFAMECDGGIPKSGLGLKEWMKRWLISSATWWLSPSKYSDQYLMFYGARKRNIYRYPFTSIHQEDLLETPIPEEIKQVGKEQQFGDCEKLVLAIGRFIPLKYYDILIHAWRFVDPTFHLLIIGGGSEKTKYESLIEEYKLNNIHLMDFLPKSQMEEYLKIADLFIHPTSSDVWGLVINEAMAKGLPVLTTNRCVAGLELIQEECIVPVGDIVTLAERMNKILMDDNLRIGLGQDNLQRIKPYTLEQMVKVHCDIFQTIKKQKKLGDATHVTKEPMKLLYIYGNCSNQKYKELFLTSSVMISQQAQKYHSLLIEGLSMNHANIRCISGLPINRSLTKKIFIPQQKERATHIKYYYSGFINVPLIRQLCLLVSSFYKTLRFIKRDRPKVIICDVLCISTTSGALAAAKMKHIKTLGIVTDIPRFLSTGVGGPHPIITQINESILGQFDGYVFLSKDMNQSINQKHKPFVVLEGHVDRNMIDRKNKLESKFNQKIILYAGSLKRIYGIEMLVQAFIRSSLSDCQLHIYGDGDYAKELTQICKTQNQIYYGGVRPNEFIMEQEIRATLLVNPRPTTNEYTKYSFPSKNLEYMVSGTPVLTTKLPGMPEEYNDLVYILKDETVEGLSIALEEILMKPKEELHEKGIRAKAYVLREKSNKKQAEIIIDLIDQL